MFQKLSSKSTIVGHPSAVITFACLYSCHVNMSVAATFTTAAACAFLVAANSTFTTSTASMFTVSAAHIHPLCRLHIHRVCSPWSTSLQPLHYLFLHPPHYPSLHQTWHSPLATDVVLICRRSHSAYLCWQLTWSLVSALIQYLCKTVDVTKP